MFVPNLSAPNERSTALDPGDNRPPNPPVTEFSPLTQALNQPSKRLRTLKRLGEDLDKPNPPPPNPIKNPAEETQIQTQRWTFRDMVNKHRQHVDLASDDEGDTETGKDGVISDLSCPTPEEDAVTALTGGPYVIERWATSTETIVYTQNTSDKGSDENPDDAHRTEKEESPHSGQRPGSRFELLNSENLHDPSQTFEFGATPSEPVRATPVGTRKASKAMEDRDWSVVTKKKNISGA
ncbi:tRNA (guanine(37)-N1)-methyltransferase 1 [Striga asiatica]|uniref:tRNA (Guanine(37)-N1)-methyltransferase 1 n=1 Tax=Striga asiatica TaxID=4170 RepID=A0A5A7PKD9_STRAF|nr:tRNA (guanine(37)-N1)-methyltransferase 1 [Striga asiatica]